VSDDVLTKPVHVALLKEAHVARLHRQGRFPKTKFGITPKGSVAAPAPSQPTSRLTSLAALQKIPSGLGVRKQAMTRAKLRVVYDQLPALPEAEKPPCETCAAPCCTVFIIHLTPEEYNSGFLAENAVRVTPEIRKGLKTRGSTLLSAYSLLTSEIEGEDSFMLEGVAGVSCPFLGSDNGCTIYEDRPLVCRTYSCVNDDRITDAMRAGDF
jgi:Fe-S-cluster containining protein